MTRHGVGVAPSCWLLAAGAVLSSAEPQAQGVSFTGRRDYLVADTPYSIVFGDFNGDGISDVAVASSGRSFPTRNGGISILLGRGDGTFQTATRCDVGRTPQALAVGDFNGDGIADLAVSTLVGSTGDQGQILVLLGNGDGSFRISETLPVERSPVSMGAADFDGDGLLDLVVANLDSSSVSVLLGNGDGSFRRGTTVGLPAGPRSLDLADFNGDGLVDLAVAVTDDRSVWLFLATGNGHFRRQRYPVGIHPFTIAAGDLDGDGVPDLAIGAEEDAVFVLLNNGDATFRPLQTVTTLTSPRSIAIGDLDGDGLPDLAVGFAEGLAVLLGEGAASFPRVRRFPVHGWPSSIRLGDLNADGRLDLAVIDGHEHIAVFLGSGDEHVFRVPRTFGGGVAPSWVAAADFNGDGLTDLVVANFASNDVSVLLGNGDGSFRSAPSFRAGGHPVLVASADFNGDGLIDLAVAHWLSMDVEIFLGNGDGTFQQAGSYAIDDDPRSLAVADFNGDGVLDLVVTHLYPSRRNIVILLLGNGDGSFQPAIAVPVPGRFSTSAASGDFNRDGLADLVVTTSDAVSVLLSNGDGTFRGRKLSAGASPNAVGVADLDGDGVEDLAVASYGIWGDDPGTLSVYLGNGDGTFRPLPTVTIASAPNSLALADFNGDGLLDVAITHGFAGDVAIMVGNGDGTFQPELYFGAGNDARSLAVSDFNGDGMPDLALPNLHSHTEDQEGSGVTVLINSTSSRGAPAFRER